MKKTIVMLSSPTDAHIPPVHLAIQQRGGVALMCDLADFPERVQLSGILSPEQAGWQGMFCFQEQTVAWDSIESVWWRRPKRPHTQRYTPATNALLDQEAFYGFLGLLLGAPGQPKPLWVSRPTAIRAAEFKASQLALARHLGLSTPRTLVTNDPQAAQAFYEACQGKIICKPVWKGRLPLEEQSAPDQPRLIYTNRVTPEHLASLEGVRATAHCFQEHIDKQFDLRVVVIGHQVFAVEIHSQDAEHTRLDWRRSYIDLHYRVHILPDEIQHRLLQLVRLFGLQYASMDLIVTPQGEYVWLEANPNGQFYWLEPPTGLPMAQAMANLLMTPEEYAL